MFKIKQIPDYRYNLFVFGDGPQKSVMLCEDNVPIVQRKIQTRTEYRQFMKATVGRYNPTIDEFEYYPRHNIEE